MINRILASLIVAMTPLALSGQGLSAAAVIPTQALVQRPAAFPRLEAPSPIVAASEVPSVSCDMPVASPNGPGAREGGVSAPANQAVAIPVVRSGCTNRQALRTPDTDLLQKP